MARVALLYSVVAICHNEEKWIRGWVKSIREKLDPDVEIVLVDTGSTDNTVTIAKELNCNVYEAGDQFVHYITSEEAEKANKILKTTVLKEGQRIFNFRDARNYADRKVRTPWAISLDLRWEILEAKNINARLTKMTDDISYLSFRLGLGNSEFDTARFYRVDRGRWKYPIHELFCQSLGNCQSFEFLKCRKISTEAHSYMPHIAYEFLVKEVDKNSEEYPRLLFYSARELYYNAFETEKYDKEVIENYTTLAKTYLGECVKARNNWFKERTQACCFLADLEPDINEKRYWYIQSISQCPVWREPYLRLADLCYKQMDWFGGLGYLSEAEKIKEQEGVTCIESLDNYGKEFYRLKYLFLVQSARVYRQTNSDKRATKAITKALEIERMTGCIEIIGHFGWIEASRIFYQSSSVRMKDDLRSYLSSNLDYFLIILSTVYSLNTENAYTAPRVPKIIPDILFIFILIIIKVKTLEED